MLWVSQIISLCDFSHKPQLEKSEKALTEFQTSSNHVFQLMPLYLQKVI